MRRRYHGASVGVVKVMGATMDFNLTEPFPVEDDYCAGLAVVEAVGPCARFVLFTTQTCWEAGGQTVYLVKRKIVMPIEAIPSGLEMTTAFLARRAMAVMATKLRDLVH